MDFKMDSHQFSHFMLIKPFKLGRVGIIKLILQSRKKKELKKLGVLLFGDKPTPPYSAG